MIISPIRAKNSIKNSESRSTELMGLELLTCCGMENEELGLLQCKQSVHIRLQIRLWERLKLNCARLELSCICKEAWKLGRIINARRCRSYFTHSASWKIKLTREEVWKGRLKSCDAVECAQIIFLSFHSFLESSEFKTVPPSIYVSSYSGTLVFIQSQKKKREFFKGSKQDFKLPFEYDIYAC